MDMRRYYAPALSLCLLLLFGCTKSEEQRVPGELFYPVSTSPYTQVSTERDSVFSYLERIDRETFRKAFGKLDEREFTRYMRTEQFDDDDYLIAFEERVTRHQGRSSAREYVTLERDSAGTFDFGYFSRFVSQTVETFDPTDLAQYIIPEDPAYLSARNQDAYLYRALPDTLMWDMTARVIEVRARPKEGDGHNIRRVRLYVERGSNRLIAIYLERIDLAMWYREESQFYVHIRPAPNGTWVPYNTRFETKIGVPFRPAQRFRTVSTYYGYADGVAG